jgi:hypothetical protein
MRRRFATASCNWPLLHALKNDALHNGFRAGKSLIALSYGIVTTLPGRSEDTKGALNVQQAACMRQSRLQRSNNSDDFGVGNETGGHLQRILWRR